MVPPHRSPSVVAAASSLLPSVTWALLERRRQLGWPLRERPLCRRRRHRRPLGTARSPPPSSSSCPPNSCLPYAFRTCSFRAPSMATTLTTAMLPLSLA